MKHKVLIMRCDDYNSEKISNIVKEGMKALGVKPSGRILLKPNTVLAHPKVFPHAFTRKEFLDGVISATRSMAENITEIAVGERSGITIPTRYNFKNAGYLEVIKRHKIKAYYFDEVKHVPVKLKARERLRDTIFIPRPIVNTDFLVNLPKFKAHPWCRLTLSLKNYIGIQDDRHRLVDHNSMLEHKIADLQEVVQSKFIAIDAITAGQRMMLTPTPFQLGAIVMGTNSCAVDTVGCHMVNVNPRDLIHLRYASARGYGPMDLDEIEISGDFPLREVQVKTRNFEFCLEPVDRYFGEDSRLMCTVGKFPEKHSIDYCWGGCPGALQEAMHIYTGFDPDVATHMKKVRYVVGHVEDPLDLTDDERVIFAGNCTRWKGTINGEKVNIESSYQNAQAVDERKTDSNDMLLKTFKTLRTCFKSRKSRYIHARGCPVSVGDHVHYLAALAKIKNVNFDSGLLIPVNIAYWQMRLHRLLNRLLT
ncbi:DUF362 domain-containing protein [Thermodesulfobacteriota bacterium]